MAKINNIGFNLNQKIANPFRTSRNSTTNPFKSSNFEGSVLQNANPFEGNTLLLNADVLEGSKTLKTNKFKMISSSVVGTMNKMRSNIAEPIINFVKRVRENVSNAWDYAKNTNVSDALGLSKFTESWNNVMNTDVSDIGKSVAHSVSDFGHNITDKVGRFNNNVTDFGKNLSKRWSGLVTSLDKHNVKITKTTPVADIRAMWEKEIALMAEREVA